jgi:hypothetical protein
MKASYRLTKVGDQPISLTIQATHSELLAIAKTLKVSEDYHGPAARLSRVIRDVTDQADKVFHAQYDHTGMSKEQVNGE